MESRKTRVAISGGGVAGATLLHALLKYPNIDAHIFESAPQFKEAGVAFGIARQATHALELIGSSATECLTRAGGVPMKGVRLFCAQGPGAGQQVFEADNERQGKQTVTIVQRADFLRELLANVPPERMHASKKLVKIDRGNDSVTLRFADGTTHECDILVGADGIHSTVRKIILGPDDAAAAPRNSGWWAVMTLQPYDKARAIIGEAPVDIEDAREYGWIGDGTLMMHNLVSRGTVVQFTILAKDEGSEGKDQWQKKVSAEEMKKRYLEQAWPPHLQKAVSELLCDTPEKPAIFLWEHPPASTYVDGPLCIMGDAAHATTPFQGSGGGMCVEDTLVLSRLLGRAASPKEALTALKIYGEIRLPRTQRIVKSSFETGKILTGAGEGIGLETANLKTALEPRWDFIIDLDVEAHVHEAIKAMDAELKMTNGK